MRRTVIICDLCGWKYYNPVLSLDRSTEILTKDGWRIFEDNGEDLCPSCVKSRAEKDSLSALDHVAELLQKNQMVKWESWLYQQYECLIAESALVGPDGQNRAHHFAVLPEGTILRPSIDPTDYTRKTLELWLEWKDHLDPILTGITRDDLEKVESTYKKEVIEASYREFSGLIRKYTSFDSILTRVEKHAFPSIEVISSDKKTEIPSPYTYRYTRDFYNPSHIPRMPLVWTDAFLNRKEEKRDGNTTPDR